jgi:hypothetical protein
MKVGDLVEPTCTDSKSPRLGLVIEVGHSLSVVTNMFTNENYKVWWGEYGTFWAPKDRLKLIQ